MRKLLLVLAMLLVGCSQPSPTTPSPTTKEQPLRSLVYLLSKARDYRPAELQSALEKALGEQGKLTEDDPESTTVELAQGWKLAYLHRKSPYLSLTSEEERKAVEDPDLRKQLQEHQAWISVDVLEQPPGSTEEDAYQRIGKLMAELGGPDVLLLMHPASNHLLPYSQKLADILRRPNYLVQLSFAPEPPTTKVAAGDPEMAAAEEEARNSFPHFCERFAKPHEGEQFYIKTPFQVDSMLEEFMWVQVTSIDDKTVHGKLANEPESIKSLELGDTVEIPREKVEDWTILDARGETLEGAFTEKVLEQR